MMKSPICIDCEKYLGECEETVFIYSHLDCALFEYTHTVRPPQVNHGLPLKAS